MDLSGSLVSPYPQLYCVLVCRDSETDSPALIHIHISPLHHTSRLKPVVWNATAQDHRAVDLDRGAHLEQCLLREAGSPAVKVSITHRWHIHSDPGTSSLVFECFRPIERCALVFKLKLKVLDHLRPVDVRV